MNDLAMIRYADWQAYTWKNELAEQLNRTIQHFKECDGDVLTDHAPLHMLERSLVICAMATRRMIEKRLMTDKFVTGLVRVRTASATTADFRAPFQSQGGGQTFLNYDLGNPQHLSLTPKASSMS